MEEGEDEPLDALVLHETPGLGQEPRAVERGVHGAVGQDALRHLADPVARNERRRPCRGERDGHRETEALDLEDVAEAAGDQQPEPGPVPLDDGVDGNGRAVREVDDPAGIHLRLRGQGGQTLQDAAGGIGRHRRRLEGGQDAGGLVENAEVGEGPADVDPDAEGRHAPQYSARRRRSPREGPPG